MKGRLGPEGVLSRTDSPSRRSGACRLKKIEGDAIDRREIGVMPAHGVQAREVTAGLDDACEEWATARKRRNGGAQEVVARIAAGFVDRDPQAGAGGKVCRCVLQACDNDAAHVRPVAARRRVDRGGNEAHPALQMLDEGKAAGLGKDEARVEPGRMMGDLAVQPVWHTVKPGLAQVIAQEAPEAALRLDHARWRDIHCEACEPHLRRAGQECLGWVGRSCWRNRKRRATSP